MRKLLLTLATAALLAAPMLAPPAVAQDWRGHRDRYDDHGRDDHGRYDDHGRDRGWHDRDIHRFHDYDYGLWREGHWFRGRHGGRLGWWWIVGDGWYFYPQPIYPYPDPYRPPVVAGPPSPGPVYYYCPRPRGYYPYVPNCPSGWQAVPAG
jgi:hypothetical protein